LLKYQVSYQGIASDAAASHQGIALPTPPFRIKASLRG